MSAPGQGRNAYPAMRIFIFGQEVSEDTLACTCNWADDTRAPNTATITLSNKPTGSNGASRYLITAEDLFALYPNDLDPVTVRLPDLKETLANDPRLYTAVIAALTLKTREEQLAFIQNTAPKLNVYGRGPEAQRAAAATLLSQSSTVLQRFAVDQFLPQIATAQDDLRAQIRERLIRITDPVKQRVLLAKFDKTQRVEQPALSETGDKPIRDARRAAFLKGEAFRYDFFAKRPIFHSNDPVRIFWRDPLNPRIWFHMFSGFISDWTRHTGVNGEETITFTCEDVLRMLRYARITTNPGIFDIRSLQQNEDFVSRTFFNDDFTNVSLTEVLYTLIFGPEVPGTTETLASQGNLTQDVVRRIKGADDLDYVRYSANGGSTTQRVPAFGIGAFNFERSCTFIFGPATSDPQTPDNEPATPLRLLRREVRINGSDALGVYQSVIDHQVRTSDIETMLLSGEDPTPRSAFVRDSVTGEPLVEEIITEIGENPHRYPIDGGRLILLMPASLGSSTSRAILERDFKGVETQTTFKNRLFVILNFLSRIEFSFYATPKGDIVAEMPLYDFDPDDFGVDEVTYSRVADATAESPAGSGARARILEAAAKGSSGPFAPHYRVSRRDLMDTNQTFTDEKVRTQFRSTWAIVQSLRGTQFADSIGLPPEVVTLRALVPQFGVRVEQAEPPVFIASKEAAQVYCQLKLNQWNAEALTEQIDMIPQLRLGPNRPIEVDDGPYIATLRSLGRTLNWEGRDMSQTVGVNYTRVWDGLVDENNDPIYVPIGGAASRPMNYAALFRKTSLEASAKERTGGTPTTLTDTGEVI